MVQSLIDFFVYEIVECFAFIAAWRGILALVNPSINKNIFPQHTTNQLLTLFGITHALFLVFVLVQTFISKQLAKRSFVVRFLAEALINLLLFFNAIITWIFYWRAIPHFINIDMDELYVHLLYHFGTFALAVVLRVSCMIVGPTNSFRDGEVAPEKNGFFEIKYLSELLQVFYCI